MDQDVPPAAKSSAKIAIVSAIFVILLICASIIWYLLRPATTDVIVDQPISPTISVPTVTPTPQLITQPPTPMVSEIATLLPGEVKYTSTLHPISFTYLENSNGNAPSGKVIVKENSNHIYIYPESLGPQGGQSVEIFEKNPAETLEAAIQRLILTGKDINKCIVSITKATNYPDTYNQAEITYPQGQGDMMQNTEYCSPDYAQTNGVRYFLEDTAHPNTFLFFNIGQYGIMAGNNIPWHLTVRIAN